MAQRAGMGKDQIRFHSDQDIVQGQFELRRLAGGVVVHTSNLIELVSLDSEKEMDARLTFLIVLEGVLELTVADRLHRAGLEPGERACCLTLPLTAQQPMQRRIRKGRRIRKVTIALEQAWFEQQGVDFERYLSQLGCQPNQPLRWRPSRRIVDLACGLLDSEVQNDPVLRNLTFEQQGLALVAELLQSLRDGKGQRSAAGAASIEATDQRLRSVIAAIDSRHARLSSLDELAGEVGMSVSALQRLFKKYYGTTVADYLRQRRLIEAKEALEHAGISIGEASYLAGYNHTSNFISAFRRTFGKTPGDMFTDDRS